MTKAVIVIFSLIFFNLCYSQQKNGLTKEQTIDLYKRLYITSKVDSIVWNGNSKTCQCGVLNNEIYKKAEDRINFFRMVVGLNKVKINPIYSQEAQAAALLIKANKLLTHEPSKTMKCYSVSADNGCRKSCLGTSDFKYYPETSFITGFIQDYGSDNYYVGHRRWLLYSRLNEFGYGATNSTEALQTINSLNSDSLKQPAYIAYPWNGFVPVNLIFPKWSFSIPEKKKVDFSKTIVIMTDSKGANIKIVKFEEYKNFVDHTLVWEVKGLFTEEEITYSQNNLEKKGYLNKKITIKIQNVKVDGKMQNFEYSVEPIKI